MSYLIARVQKYKSGDVNGIGRHNNRIGMQKNKDIKHELTPTNVHLVGSEGSYMKKVKDIIDREREKYGVTQKVRNDAVQMCEILVTSDEDFFARLHPLERQRFFKVAHDFLCEKYCSHNVVASTVHLDENTPHMHFTFVPIREGKLQAKTIIGDRNDLRDFQTAFHAHMNAKGFQLERGELREITDDKHIKVQDFKKQKREEQEREEQLKAVLNGFKHLPDVKTEKPLFGATRVVLSEEDWQKMMAVLTAVDTLKYASNAKDDTIKALESEIARHKADVKKQAEQKSRVQKKLKDLTANAPLLEYFMGFFKLNPKANELFLKWYELQKQYEKNNEKIRQPIKRPTNNCKSCNKYPCVCLGG